MIFLSSIEILDIYLSPYIQQIKLQLQRMQIIEFTLYLYLYVWIFIGIIEGLVTGCVLGSLLLLLVHFRTFIEYNNDNLTSRFRQNMAEGKVKADEWYKIHYNVLERQQFSAKLSVVKSETCGVCMENPSTHAFVPCGHKCICEACAKFIMPGLSTTISQGKTCPLCRTPTTMIMKIF